MRPAIEDLVRAVANGLEADLMPELQTDFGRQTARLMLGLLRQVEVMVREQELALREDNDDLRPLVERIRAWQSGGEGGGAEGTGEASPGATAGAAERSSLQEQIVESDRLRGELDRGLGALHGAPAEDGGAEVLHAEVRAYLARQLEREGRFHVEARP